MSRMVPFSMFVFVSALPIAPLSAADWEAGKWPINFGSCVSQEMARMVVHDSLDLSGPVDAADMFDARVP